MEEWGRQNRAGGGWGIDLAGHAPDLGDDFGAGVPASSMEECGEPYGAGLYFLRREPRVREDSRHGWGTLDADGERGGRVEGDERRRQHGTRVGGVGVGGMEEEMEEEVVGEGSKGGMDRAADDVSEDWSWGGESDGLERRGSGGDKAEDVLRRYVELHNKMVDPEGIAAAGGGAAGREGGREGAGGGAAGREGGREGAGNKFLLLRSAHGIGNTMIEEVTALLLAMVSGRALVIDFRGGGVFGLERPAHCFQRPLALDFELLLPLLEAEEEFAGAAGGGGMERSGGAGAVAVGGGVFSRMQKVPEDGSGGYSRYAELLGCSDWHEALGESPWLVAEHLFGFPFAFLNPSLRPLLSPGGTFGDNLFQVTVIFVVLVIVFVTVLVIVLVIVLVMVLVLTFCINSTRA